MRRVTVKMDTIDEIMGKWLTLSLSEQLSQKTVAYCLNLYDSPFRIDLVGTSRFSSRDYDWACDEVWSPSDRILDLPVEYSILPWEERLELCTNILRRFLVEESPAANILQSAEAVAISFCDGDLTIVHQRTF